MSCTNCNYEHVDIHRTGEAKITYCQQCGHSTEEKRDPPREKWTTQRRAISPLRKATSPTAITHLIPLPDKKRKRG